VLIALCGLGLPPGRDAILQWLAAAAIGMGLTWVLVLSLGVAGHFPRGVLVAWAAIGILSALDDVRRRRQRMPRIEPTSWNVPAFVALALTPLLLIAWRRWGFRFRHLAEFAGGVMFVAPLWMIQNAVLVRNPFSPFLNAAACCSSPFTGPTT